MNLHDHRFQLTIELAGRSAAHLDNALPALAEGGWRVVATAAAPPRASLVSPMLSHADLPAVQDGVRAIRASGARLDSTCRMVLRIDAARLDAHGHRSLQSIVAKQAPLLAHALGHPTESVAFRRVKAQPFAKEAIEFTWPATPHPGELGAFVVLALAIVERARTARGASSKPRPFEAASAKYDFRCFLLRLGLVGDAYRDAREQLLKRLPGSAAWRQGRPPRAERTRPVAPLELA